MRTNVLCSVARFRSIAFLGFAFVFCLTGNGAHAGAIAAARAEAIRKATRFEGGLIVHLGCGDGKLTAALRADNACVVHGLDRDMRNVQAARKRIRSRGEYGPVAVAQLAGERLPYIDNLVNLVVAEELGSIPRQEILRVLAPEGIAYIKSGDAWTRIAKPLPKAIDEWTHWLHDATNNAVANDKIVGPPRQLHWVRGPKWARSHDHLASVSAAASSGGRLFYIVDEGPIAAVVLKPDWNLVACDAFSGATLWKHPIGRWEWHLRGFRSGPSDIARRLVAVNDRLYVTLAIDAPVSELDAVTGKTVRTLDGTDNAREIVCADGIVFVVVGDPEAEEAAEQARRRGQRPGFAEVRSQRPPYPKLPPRKRILAFEAETGQRLWKKGDADTQELMPCTLAAANGKVYFQNADEILSLDAKSGKQIWRTARRVSRHRPAWTAPTLVVYEDVVFSADRQVQPKPEDAEAKGRKVAWYVSSAGGRAPVGELIAFSAETGERLWSAKCEECYNAPTDVLVADGLVWTGELVRAKEPGITSGLDPKTGQVKRTRPRDQQFFQPGMGHHRCYRNKATEKYLVLGRSGVEFIDVASGEGIPHHWTRGTCQYGVIPCNGLLYVPPHSCACFITAKLRDFNCFAPASGSPPATVDKQNRLVKGPAYGKIDDQTAGKNDWPSYRCDAKRSGSIDAPVPAKLAPAWRTELDGRLTPVVITGGKLFAAQIDAHTIHALRASDGEKVWCYTAGGRIDSPPTIWKGHVLFGSADGWVYCLRASDGAEAWRFRAAPRDVRIMVRDQLESAWPVPGSVLVRDGVVYCAAGRSSYLDGGIRLIRLDAETGKLLSETVLDHRDPKTGYQRKEVVRGTNMPGALPDVLSSDGQSVFLRHIRFDLQGKQLPNDVPHLYSPAGFLDDAWWHRTYWMVGTSMGTAYGGWPRVGMQVPAGRLLAVDGPLVYGFGRSQYHHTGGHVGIDAATVFHFRGKREEQWRTTRYRAFAMRRTPEREQQQAAKGKRRGKRGPARKDFLWTRELPMLVRAMALAKDHLLMAGPPDLFATDDPIGALHGKEGGKLMVLSAKQGKPLAAYDLKSPPVFDGLAAADTSVYLATAAGEILCFRGTR